ncbi:MAG: aspartyl/asparaginyl beta-hydroxylase domain-containing protein [Candidatus Eremiobacteraeota bacterium]|nr:aspartyl/asparaginyl beta-hydroxylase domain-containing protein [Candidatus Eremiobacteraeota bacterium]
MFYDPAQYVFVRRLVESAGRIRDEYYSLNADILSVHRNKPIDEFFASLEQTKNGWTPSWQVDSAQPNYNWLTYVVTYGRRFFPEAEQKYPATRAALDHDAVRVGGFSLLKALSIIAPHDHPELGNGILTCHIGIDVVPGTSFLNVDDVFEEERLGKAVVFDGSKRHFALNASLRDRVVLYVEFDSTKA